jgi:hypothetical protein
MNVYKKITKKIKQLIGLQCDTCGKRCDFDHVEIILQQQGETNRYDFCSLKCSWKFVTKECAKENPRLDIEFGKEN